MFGRGIRLSALMVAPTVDVKSAGAIVQLEGTVVEDGFLEASAICSGRYASACKENGVQ